MHMWTCWASAPLSKSWMDALERLSMGEEVDLRPLVEGYGAGVDTPVSDVYIELAKQFPEAKVGGLGELGPRDALAKTDG